MKTFSIFFITLLSMLLISESYAQKFYPPFQNGSLYLKTKTNVLGKHQEEVGFSQPLIKWDSLSLSSNIGFVFPLTDQWRQANTWTAGVTLSTALTKEISLYTKAATNLRGPWTQETGMRVVLVKNTDYSWVLNGGYVMDHPLDGRTGRWTIGLAVQFPLSKK